MSYSPHVFGNDSSSGADPATWDQASYTDDPVDHLEPIEIAPSEYRQKALDCMEILRQLDDFVTESEDPRLAWVAASRVLGLPALRDVPATELARQMGVSTRTLSDTVTEFRTLTGIEPVPGKLVPWL